MRSSLPGIAIVLTVVASCSKPDNSAATSQRSLSKPADQRGDGERGDGERGGKQGGAGHGGGGQGSGLHGGHGGHGGGHFEHRFQKAKDWEARFDDPQRDGWQKPARVIELLEVASGMTVADIGAGTGYFLPHLARAVGPSGTVLALDLEPDMVRHMTERAQRDKLTNVTARVIAADDPKLDQNSVDRVVIVNTWHHIAGRGDYARRLHSALRPGGTVAIVDYTKEAPQGPPKRHRLAPEQVVAELRAGGLEAAAIEEDLPLQYIVVGRAADSAAN